MKFIGKEIKKHIKGNAHKHVIKIYWFIFIPFRYQKTIYDQNGYKISNSCFSLFNSGNINQQNGGE